MTTKTQQDLKLEALAVCPGHLLCAGTTADQLTSLPDSLIRQALASSSSCYRKTQRGEATLPPSHNQEKGDPRRHSRWKGIKINKFVEMLEDLEDVQDVYNNMETTDEVDAALEAEG